MPVKHSPDVVIFEGNYPAWPCVTRDAAGRLYCTLREDGIVDRQETGHGYSPLGKTLITWSDDGGRTWSAPTVVSDLDGKDDTGGGVAVLPDQSLIVSFYSRFGPSGAPSQAWVSRRPMSCVSRRDPRPDRQASFSRHHIDGGGSPSSR